VLREHRGLPAPKPGEIVSFDWVASDRRSSESFATVSYCTNCDGARPIDGAAFFKRGERVCLVCGDVDLVGDEVYTPCIYGLLDEGLVPEC
jgi:hypothetical protein